MRVEYSTNNSGGSWWLEDKDWYALEEAGWTVKWYRDQTDRHFIKADKDGRWLGALATNATREGLSLGDAIEEWERVTQQDSSALGCSCCGTPHFFTFEGDNGERDYYSPDFPSHGSRYS